MDTVDAELARTAASAGVAVDALLPRDVAVVALKLSRVLDLRDPAILGALGVTSAAIATDDLTTPQAIGEAAHQLGFEAVVAPSATGVGDVVAIFLTNRVAASSIEVTERRSHKPAP